MPLREQIVQGLLLLKEEVLVGYPTLRVAGSDEVGRGCIAGPVVAAAVILPGRVDLEKYPWLKKVQDSKKLSSFLREELAPLIHQWAMATAIGVASAEEIDHLNIFHASHLAMIRALENLAYKAEFVLIDGKFLPQKQLLKMPGKPMIKGDQTCLSIAAASIIAKVWRDHYMTQLDRDFPGYGFAQHKGYPTVIHLENLKKRGVTELHRRTFKPVLKTMGEFRSIQESEGFCRAL